MRRTRSTWKRGRSSDARHRRRPAEPACLRRAGRGCRISRGHRTIAGGDGKGGICRGFRAARDLHRRRAGVFAEFPLLHEPPGRVAEGGGAQRLDPDHGGGFRSVRGFRLDAGSHPAARVTRKEVGFPVYRRAQDFLGGNQRLPARTSVDGGLLPGYWRCGRKTAFVLGRRSQAPWHGVLFSLRRPSELDTDGDGMRGLLSHSQLRRTRRRAESGAWRKGRGVE